MKKILYFILVITVGLVSCQDTLEDEFQDPEKNSPRPEDKIPGMLTKMLTTRFFHLNYFDWYYTLPYCIPGYVQVSCAAPVASWRPNYTDWGDLDGNGNFYPGMEPIKRFNQFYVDLKNYGLLRDEIEVLSGKELDDNEIYLLMATVIKNAIALQMVDLFNSIPYTDAFKGTKGVFFTKYDDAKTIYVTALDELTTLTTNIPQAHAKMSDNAKEKLAKQDIAFSGDTQKWVQYINAVRLRHAMRMSGVDEGYAKQQIAAVLNNLPTADFIMPAISKSDLKFGSSGNSVMYARALYERMVYGTYIPNVVMQRMNYGDLDYVEGEDDPRLPVLANPIRYSTKNWRYNGTSMNADAIAPYWTTNDLGPGKTFKIYYTVPYTVNDLLRVDYSSYSVATFTFGEIPAYLASLAENDLFMAEIELKGLGNTGKTAPEHIKNAVTHSIDFWYQVNGLSNLYSTLTNADTLQRIFAPKKPAEDVIDQFASKIQSEFNAASGLEDKMEIIMQQKYIHHNIMNIYELWAEQRRTRHPKIEKVLANGVTYAPVPERLMYPNSEAQTNAENLKAVVDQNNFTTPIFWVPESKKSESLYMDGYLPLIGYDPLP